MKNTLKRIASFVWDIPIEKGSSEHNPYLEVVWSNGKKMLNTKDANFSFGNGYLVFNEAFKHINENLPSAQNVLILGFGCGSILHLLEKKHQYNGKVTGVEYDSVILELFHKHFAQRYTTKPNLITADALDFVAHYQDSYDIIFIDLFNELENVEFIFNHNFVDNLKGITSEKGVLVFNTIKQTTRDQENISELIMSLSNHFKDVSSHPFQNLNHIIIAK